MALNTWSHLRSPTTGQTSACSQWLAGGDQGSDRQHHLITNPLRFEGDSIWEIVTSMA